MNFCGSELFSLDEKNRLVIPAKMARNIPSYAERTFYVTRGLDGSIYGYTKDVWESVIMPRMFERNQTEPGNRNVIRMMSELAVEVKLDGQNKISIPKNLLTDAGITKEVKIIGVYDHIEFWNPDRYNNLMNVSESSYEDVAKYIFYKDN